MLRIIDTRVARLDRCFRGGPRAEVAGLTWPLRFLSMETSRARRCG
jgi:hypothetical protein